MSTIFNDCRMDSSALDGSTERLVEQAQAGNLAAFHELVVEHQREVRLFIARRISCSAQADDLAQEVFLCAFRQIGQIESTSSFLNWLLGISRNKLREHWRSHFRQQRQWQEFSQSPEQAFHENGPRQEELAEEHASFVRALTGCLGELPKRSRNVVEQFYFEQVPATEIARQQNCSAGAIRMKLLRIREILHRCILRRSSLLDAPPPNAESHPECEGPT